MSVTVLRLEHRPERDKRVTTHLFLAARAFGACSGMYTGIRDPSMEDSIRGVVARWGGDFDLSYSDGWRNIIDEWSGDMIHLTMYGLKMQNVIDSIRETGKPKLIVVGGAKVPGGVYGRADWNVAVTSQPHSEVSALAVFLHEYFQGDELSREYPGARLRIVPRAHGKKVENVRV
ncbi:MAG: tRNA (cytidine(56)-2'-O)-methyltransferase [Candidatus Bathyarchaeia archaeon]